MYPSHIVHCCQYQYMATTNGKIVRSHTQIYTTVTNIYETVLYYVLMVL